MNFKKFFDLICNKFNFAFIEARITPLPPLLVFYNYIKGSFFNILKNVLLNFASFGEISSHLKISLF